MIFLAGTWLWLAGRYSWRPGYWAYPRPGRRWRCDGRSGSAARS